MITNNTAGDRNSHYQNSTILGNNRGALSREDASRLLQERKPIVHDGFVNRGMLIARIEANPEFVLNQNSLGGEMMIVELRTRESVIERGQKEYHNEIHVAIAEGEIVQNIKRQGYRCGDKVFAEGRWITSRSPGEHFGKKVLRLAHIWKL